MDPAVVTIFKKITISSAHVLKLDYESKCNTLHGHNYGIEIWVTGKCDKNGMILDFNHIKKVVMKLDHININDIIEPSTAEMISIYVAKKINDLASERITKVIVRVWETDSAYAEHILGV